MKHLLILLAFALLSCKEDKEETPTPQAKILTPCDSTGYNYVVDVVFDTSVCKIVDLNSNIGENLSPTEINESLFISLEPSRIYFPEKPRFIRIVDCNNKVTIFREFPDCYFRLVVE